MSTQVPCEQGDEIQSSEKDKKTSEPGHSISYGIACAPSENRSAWAIAQAYQNLCYSPVSTECVAKDCLQADSKDSDKPSQFAKAYQSLLSA